MCLRFRLGALVNLDSFGGGFRCGRFRLRRRLNFLLQMAKFIFNKRRGSVLWGRSAGS